jgi:hypothetical protein
MRATTVWVLTGLVLLVAAAASAQVDGRIEGTVTAEDGSVLPGATVKATSPAMIGERVATSDDQGAFRLVNLPPGLYEVSSVLEGFGTVQNKDIKVGIDQTVRLTFSMKPAFAGEIQVTGEQPAVDVTKATTGVSVSSDDVGKLPLPRDFYSVAQITTGSARDAIGTTFYGSTGAENTYNIEGLNITGGRYGTESKALNYDFIQEVEVKTGGLTAEYGRLTGGLINAITKSGSNDFQGNVFGFYEDGSNNSTEDELTSTAASVRTLDTNFDYGFALGGAFVEDRLWYFAAYTRKELSEDHDITAPIAQIPGQDAPPAEGSVFGNDITTDLYSGKLTWAVTQEHNLSFSLVGDPSTTDGVVLLYRPSNAIAGPSSTFDGEQDSGSDDYLGRYNGVIGTSWVVEALAGHHEDQNEFSGAGVDIPRFIDRTGALPFPEAGGFGPYENEENTRDVLKADVSKFIGSKFELKVGADQEDIGVVTDRFNGGAGQRIYIFNPDTSGAGSDTEPGQPFVYRHRYYVDLAAPGFDRDDPATYVKGEPLHAEPETENTSGYIQGSIRPTENFTINLGLRWEEQEIGNSGGLVAADIDDNYAPRIQMTWDPSSDGSSKVYASFGRYFESIPADINVRSFGNEAICFCYNFSSDPNVTAALPDDRTGYRTALLGGPTPVDPDLEGQYLDEYLLGYEREVGNNLTLGIQGTYRELGQVIEDFLVDAVNGQYAIANPGQGLGRTIYFYDYVAVAGSEANREYTSVEVSARKRFTAGWQVYASYLWSELEGNYDGVFQASTGQLDPNINSAFDYADFFINADGKLSNDREHSLKFNGSYTFQEGAADDLTIGASAYWRSGTPLTAYGYSFGYSNWEYYLTPRGSLGRNPDDYELNLHVDYPFKFGNGREISVIVDVFNVLNRQALTTYDQRYNLESDGPCGGIPGDICGAGGGLLYTCLERDEDGNCVLGDLDPVAQLADPRATAPNPNFLDKGFNFTSPRSIRVGARVRF